MENDHIVEELHQIKVSLALIGHDMPKIDKIEARMRRVEDKVLNNSLVLRAALAVTGVVGSASVAVAFSVIKEMM